jgi:hypothetical protein
VEQRENKVGNTLTPGAKLEVNNTDITWKSWSECKHRDHVPEFEMV